jgi:MFS family permease
MEDNMKESLRIFRNTSFLKLWAGHGISIFGDMITFLAIPMIVYNLTGSKSALSLSVLVRVIPVILIGPFAGALVDRLNRKTIMIWSDLLRAMLTVLLLMSPDKHLLTMIYIVVFLKSLIGIFFNPAFNSSIPSILKKEDLMAGNSVFGVTSNILQFVSPFAGAALIAFLGARSVLFIDMISFIVSAMAIYFVDIPNHSEKTRKLITPGVLLKDILEGFKFMINSKTLTIIMITTLITQFGQGFIAPLWLPYVIEGLKRPAQDLGYLVAMQGFGSILGTTLLLLIGVRKSKSYKLLYSIFTLMTGVTIFLQITTLNFSIFIIWGTLVGVFISGMNVSTQTIVQHIAKNEILGRVSSTLNIINQGFMAAAVAIAGLMGNQITTRVLFIIACSIWLVGCIIGSGLMLLNKETVTDEESVEQQAV